MKKKEETITHGNTEECKEHIPASSEKEDSQQTDTATEQEERRQQTDAVFLYWQ